MLLNDEQSFAQLKLALGFLYSEKVLSLVQTISYFFLNYLKCALYLLFNHKLVNVKRYLQMPLREVLICTLIPWIADYTIAKQVRNY